MATKKDNKRHGFRNWVHGIVNVYCREFSLIAHDLGLIIFFSFLPLVYPLVYSLIYNKELVKEVPMVVIDEDRTPLSRELVRNIDACDQVWVIGYASDLGEARHAMAEGKCYSILQIPSGFERKVGRQETSPAVLYCEMSLLLRYRGFLVAATEVMQEMGGEIMAKTINSIAPLATTITDGDLLPIVNANMGNLQGGFDSFIMPGVLILILQQCLILAIGMAGGAKRESSKLIRYNPDNVTKSTFGTMLGQSLCYITIIALPSIYLIHYVPLFFRFPMAGSLFEEIMFLTPMVLACIGMGFCFQALVTERESVFVSWVITSIMFLYLSGLIWPRYDMPAVWRAVSAVCPSTWGMEGFVKMNANGSSLAQVRTEYLNLWILAAGWGVLGWCAQKWVVRPIVLRSMALKRSIREQVFAAPDSKNEISNNTTTESYDESDRQA